MENKTQREMMMAALRLLKEATEIIEGLVDKPATAFDARARFLEEEDFD